MTNLAAGSVKGKRASGVGIGSVWSSLTVPTRIGINPKRMIVFRNNRMCCLFFEVPILFMSLIYGAYNWDKAQNMVIEKFWAKLVTILPKTS